MRPKTAVRMAEYLCFKKRKRGIGSNLPNRTDSRDWMCRCKRPLCNGIGHALKAGEEAAVGHGPLSSLDFETIADLPSTTSNSSLLNDLALHCDGPLCTHAILEMIRDIDDSH